MQYPIVILVTLIVSTIEDYVPHEGASSFQHFHMNHYFPVPLYMKKDDEFFLKHPLQIGESSSRVSIQHGDKDNAGYATVSTENEINPNFHLNTPGESSENQAENSRENQENTSEEQYSSESNYDQEHNGNSEEDNTQQHNENGNVNEEATKPPLFGFYQQFVPNNLHGQYFPVPDPMSLVALADEIQ